VRVGLLAVAAVVAACYSPSFTPCSIECDGNRCPHDMTCGTDGFCHGSGEPVCGPVVDASIPVVDGMSLPDGDVADAGGDAACRVALLRNGGFEVIEGEGDGRTAPPWAESFLPANPFLADGEGAPSFLAHDGSYGLRFEGNNLDGTVKQRLGKLPAGTHQLELTMFYRSTGTEDVLEKDTLTFTLEDISSPTSVELAGLDGVEETTAWSQYQAVIDVSPGPAQEWDFEIQIVSGSTKPTRFELDDLTLDAIVCGP
jgi:hypothetical protein